MVILSSAGVEYIDCHGRPTLAERGQDIPQEAYDAMAPHERYAAICHFASQGCGPDRFEWPV